MGVSDMLKYSADQTVDLLKLELQIELGELQEKWHFASLEKIFIENKIYVEFDGKTYEEAKEVTKVLLQPHIKHLVRDVTEEDIEKLMEIRMRRITKHDAEKADTYIASLEEEIARVKNHLDHLIEFAIDYFKRLKKKYGEGRERKTEIRPFENIEATKVAISNVKLYANLREGFVGHGLKRGEGEFISDCADIDDIICIRRDGTLVVTRIADKTFVGKDLIHVGVWKKGDTRTIYNLMYQDGATGPVRAKRFAVTSITRDREYPLTKGTPKSKVLYLTVNPNGEAEVVSVIHRNTGKIRKLKLDFDFAEMPVKGRGAGGNIVTRHAVNKIQLKEEGVSTLPARKIWFDDTVQRLNTDGRGEYLGAFKGEDKILQITSTGHYKLTGFELTTKFEEDYLILEKWNKEKPITAVYWDGEKDQYTVKRFLVEESEKKVNFLNEHEETQLEVVSTDYRPRVGISFDKRSNDREDEEVNLEEFISVKGLAAKGNRLTPYKVKSIDLLESLPHESDAKESPDEEEEMNDKPKGEPELPSSNGKGKKGNDDESQITLSLDL
jgi:topoisomerase-4 subunit A